MILETALILGTGANLITSSKTRVALIEKCSEALGGAFKPWQIRREAQAKAEARIIDAKADQEIANLAQRAMDRQLGQAMREQQNIESIIIGALPNIDEDASPEKIEEDWLANFFDKNRLVSNEQMQHLWSQVLAGESNKQGSFSTRTVNLLSSLSADDALMFRKLCTFTLSINDIEPYIILDIGNLGKLPFNISYPEIVHLENIGFISLDNTNGYSITAKEIEIKYYGIMLLIKLPPNSKSSIYIGNVVLTTIGEEMSSIVTPEINYDILDYWENYYISKGYKVSRKDSATSGN